MIFCTRKAQKYKTNCHNYIQFRSFINHTVESFENILRSQEFPNYSEFDNVDIAYSDFISRLTNAVNVSAPCRRKRTKAQTEEWFDGEIAESILLRNKLYKKFKKNRIHINEQIFKEAKYKVVNLIKQKKKEFFKNKLNENIGRPKELWKTIKSLGLPNKKSNAGNICLKDQMGELQFNSEVNTKIFKNFFSNLASDLVNKLPMASNIFTDTSTTKFYEGYNIIPNSFNFYEINESYIYKQLIAINSHKAAGIDNISGRFLKDGSKVLALPISQICNLSIKLSTFPKDCKVAKITPLYKKGSRTEAKNYRPISLLPIISKVIEKTIHQQLEEYLSSNHIFYKFQSGFRSNHSTDTCLTYLSNKILTGFDNGLLTGLIAIDLQKAFDTIDHAILLRKMKILGFSENVIKWFTSYLSNRVFHVNINNTLSDAGEVNSGVPHGSILGTMLF